MSVTIIDRLKKKYNITLVSTSKIAYKIFSNKNVRKFTTTLSKEGSILPVVLLESSVIAGRTYHANERGGKVEARERFTEESLAAVVWLWGMKTFNKAYDGLMKTIGMKHIGVDLGNDAVRNPIEKFFKSNPKAKRLTYSIAKFAKPVLSAGMTIAIVGGVIPRYIHKMTDERIKNETKEINKAYQHSHPEATTNNTNGNNFLGNTTLSAQKRVTIEEFLDNAKKNPLTFTSLGGLTKGLTQMAYNLENKDIYQLLTVDVGLTSGRAMNARNKDERREIIFRDGASAIFYSLSTPIIAKALAHFDLFKAKNTNLDPTTVDFVHNEILNKTALKDSEMTIEQFKENVLGKKHIATDDIIKDAEKVVLKRTPDNPKAQKKAIEQFAISIDEFKDILKNKVSKEEYSQLVKKAHNMSKLQPEHHSMGKIISKTQLEDVLTKGMLREPEFMKQALEEALRKPKVLKFLAKEGKETLDNPERFISQDKIDATRKNIIEYVESIIEAAEKEAKKQADKEIIASVKTEAGNISKKPYKLNKNLLEHMKVRNTKYKLIYTLAGMGVSAAFLSYIIPKAQYFMTKQRTGDDGFPGVKEYKA